MANTGLLSPSNTKYEASYTPFQGSNMHDADDSTFGQQYNLNMSGGSRTTYWYNFAGSDLPAGSTVNGVEVVFIGMYNVIGNQTQVAWDIGIGDSTESGATGATYQSVGAQTYSSTKTTYTIGADDDLHSIDWSGFTDISDICLKSLDIQVGSGLWITELYDVYIKVYYTPPPTPQLKLSGGKFIMSGGKFRIK